MPHAFDPEVLQAMMTLASASGRAPLAPAARGDWTTLRANSDVGHRSFTAALPVHAEVAREDYSARSHDGIPVALRWFAPEGHDPTGAGPAVVFLHGGGMIMGSVEQSDRFIAAYAAESGVPVLAVDYRLAPEHPYPHPVEDCYAGLGWLAAHADSLGVDAGRIALMGESAGGGLAAGTALLARDRGPAVAWEGLDVHGKGSLNHYSKGAVISFLHSYVAGLRPMPDTPAWQEFEVRPCPGGGITAGRAQLDTPYGPIGVAWQTEDGALSLRVRVAPGTRARVTLPDGTTSTRGPGDHTFSANLA